LLVAVIYSLLWLVATGLFADLKRWRIYYPTMLYAAVGNLMYDLICYSYPLWELEANGLPNQTIPSMLLVLIGMPFSTFVFLSNYPAVKPLWHRIAYCSLFVGIFVVLEWISLLTGSITHHHGWNLAWSGLFNCMMFPFLLLHHRRPLVALGLSVPLVLLLMAMFDVTLDRMK
jgi:hypothetical protein